MQSQIETQQLLDKLIKADCEAEVLRGFACSPIKRFGVHIIITPKLSTGNIQLTEKTSHGIRKTNMTLSDPLTQLFTRKSQMQTSPLATYSHSYSCFTQTWPSTNSNSKSLWRKAQKSKIHYYQIFTHHKYNLQQRFQHTSYLSLFLHNRNLRPGNFTLESA